MPKFEGDLWGQDDLDPPSQAVFKRYQKEALDQAAAEAQEHPLPPPSFEELHRAVSLEAQKVQPDFGRERGTQSGIPDLTTGPVILDLSGLDTDQRQQVIAKIVNAANERSVIIDESDQQ